VADARGARLDGGLVTVRPAPDRVSWAVDWGGAAAPFLFPVRHVRFGWAERRHRRSNGYCRGLRGSASIEDRPHPALHTKSLESTMILSHRKSLPRRLSLRRGIALLATGALTVLIRGSASPRPRRRAPAAVAGTLVFSDDSNGAAGSGVTPRTGCTTPAPARISAPVRSRRMTNSTNNVHLDGNGNLDPPRSAPEQLDFRPDPDAVGRGGAPAAQARGDASIQQPNPGPTASLLAGVLELGQGQCRETRDRHHRRMSTARPRSPAPSTAACPRAARATRATASAVGCAPRGGCQNRFHT